MITMRLPPHLVFLLVLLSGVLGSLPAVSHTSIEFTLEQAGRVSIAIYEPDSGRMLRTLLAGVPHEVGRHSVTWDGLDANGQPVAPGSYEWRLLRVPGFTAEYKLNIGSNAPDASWAFWPGNHGGVFGVAADETGLYVGASSSEVAPTFVKLTPDFKTRLWEKHHLEAWTGVQRLLVGNDAIYVMQNNARLYILDRDNGRVLKKLDLARDRELGDDRQARQAAGARLSIGIGSTHAVVAYQDQDRLRWLDLESGEVVAEAEMQAPLAVAVTGTEVLIASGDSLWRLTAPDAEPAPLAEGLVNPQVLEVDPWTGEILLVEGDPSHQIKRFSAAGELMATYGIAGGRRVEGAYDQPTSFRDVADIAPLPDGGFSITEPTRAPRRTALFNRVGELVTEWYGGHMYFQSAEPDPRDPHDVWLDSHWGYLTRARVDYANGTWQPTGSYVYGGKAMNMIRVHNSLPGYASHAWRAVYRGETRYLVHEGHPTLMRHDEEAEPGTGRRGSYQHHPLLGSTAALHQGAAEQRQALALSLLPVGRPKRRWRGAGGGDDAAQMVGLGHQLGNG